jgi:hypothetical protein
MIHTEPPDRPHAAVRFADRCHHYENAFEALLRARRVAFTAIAEAHSGRPGAKTFDYIVRPDGPRPCLVDVKGRKLRASGGSWRGRRESWVTQADLDGLARWTRVFGRVYSAAFVFAYWITDGFDVDRSDGANENREPVFVYAGRQYAFRAVGFDAYRRACRTRSSRWNTVDLASADFERLSRPVAVPGGPNTG